MSLQDLPVLNACLNGLSAIFLALGYAAIRSGRVQLHRALMLSALICSALFLVSYLTYHAFAGHVRFQGQGPIRLVYFPILFSHTLLATLNAPFILRLVYLAWRERFEEHRRLARWVWPSWMYVSATGVVVYWMLYRL